MSFTARYPGECSECGNQFDQGDEIEYNSAGEIVWSECCGVSDDAFDFDPEDDRDWLYVEGDRREDRDSWEYW